VKSLLVLHLVKVNAVLKGIIAIIHGG